MATSTWKNKPRQTCLNIYQLSKGRCGTGFWRAESGNEGWRHLETDGWSQQSLIPVADMNRTELTTNLSHAEVPLNVAKDVIDKHLAIILYAQQVLSTRPRQVNHSTTFPLHKQQTHNDYC